MMYPRASSIRPIPMERSSVVDLRSVGNFSQCGGSSADVSAGLVYTKNTNGDEFGGGLRITWAF